MSSNSKIAVILLAAGASTRLGTAKQLLPWRKTTLLEHVIETISELQCGNNFVVLGSNNDLIKSKINFKKVEVLVNDKWNLGLGNSIAYGVKHLINNNIKVDGVLLMLADQPLIDSNYLNILIDKFEGKVDRIVASSYSKGKNGVPVIFGKTYFEELSNLSGDKGAKSLLKKYSQYISTINAAHLVLDIDTKEDYERLFDENY